VGGSAHLSPRCHSCYFYTYTHCDDRSSHQYTYSYWHEYIDAYSYTILSIRM
jgi:hypothetical protein